ncbi:MAG: phosphate ABC transporter substrate-binding protein PstS [Gemmatimonadaceae bacterium]
MILATRFLASISALALIAACARDKTGSAGGTTGAAASGVDLTGAGATFPNPIYAKWFSDYAAKTGVRINYQSIGSGGGVRQIQEQTVDFGATDGPMSDEELSRAKGGPLMHFPTVLGADVLGYNLPGVSQRLKLSGDAIADIYLGKVTKWNDPRIATLNPGVSLPNSDILVVHRSDGSGTTYVFTDYLAAVSPEWKRVVGRGKEVKWPTGIGAKGNEGVAGQVKQTPGSIGYMELAYAKQNNLAHALVKNAAGNFVEATIPSITAAAEGAALPPNTDYRVSIVNAPGANAYPISSFTWLLIYRNQTDAAKAQKLKDFLRWAYSDGEQLAGALDYAPLPGEMAQRLTARLDLIQAGTTQ